ncbi:MAG TPA: AI-2E family transporter, partial [Solirubrobacteraceae bacterium]|nr:AI-2E family transporter [Solirubrobacteraceae bacterium]
LVVLVVYQQVENNVLQPFVYRRTVNVPPLVVILAILVGSALLGVLGALVAIPVAAAVQILLGEYGPQPLRATPPAEEEEEEEEGTEPPPPAAATESLPPR